jgi:hypothetical protein
MAKAPNSPGLRVTRGNTMTISKGKRRAIAAMTDEQLREVRDELTEEIHRRRQKKVYVTRTVVTKRSEYSPPTPPRQPQQRIKKEVTS